MTELEKSLYRLSQALSLAPFNEPTHMQLKRDLTSIKNFLETCLKKETSKNGKPESTV